ncbi:flavodoxin domain-containing protein [Oricola sp.]|uniref:flavodoxin domain-containing protein n=1 Tax=Oricola sp. TaxID=1979950 RepID=UPI003BA91A5E
MRILLVYATVEGHTRKVCNHIKATLEGGGHQVVVIDASDETALPDPDTIDAVIAAAPVHTGTFPVSLRRLLKRQHEQLMARPGAFISISLSAAGSDEDDMAEIVKITGDMGEETGWWPVAVHHAAGALKYTEYDFFRRWALRRIAFQNDGPTDTDRDYEFTDWVALDTFVTGFVKEAPKLAGKI